MHKKSGPEERKRETEKQNTRMCTVMTTRKYSFKETVINTVRCNRNVK